MKQETTNMGYLHNGRHHCDDPAGVRLLHYRESVRHSVAIGLCVPVRAGYWPGNVALLLFFAALVAAGLRRGTHSGASFQEMMELIRP